MKNGYRFLRGSLALSSLFLALTCFSQAHAQTPAAAPAAPPPPTAEERIATLEAYVNNVDPVKGPLVGVAGPGHNA